MSLVGMVFIVCALIVLFDVIATWLEKNKIVDFSKNESLRKSVELVEKMTAPVYNKIYESLPEKYRTASVKELIPCGVFIVFAVIGQFMW